MKIIEPSVQLLRPSSTIDGIQSLRFIEHMARISHRSEEAQTADSWDRFLRSVVIDHGDWSVVEHGTATTIFRVDRGVTHELVRHRLFSFTQESTRFVNGRKSYPEGLEFVLPVGLNPEALTNMADNRDLWAAAMRTAEEIYLRLLDAKVRPQEARSVLPNALAATIAVTGNYRNWRHFLIMRTTQETHPDFRRVTIPLLQMFQERVPILFEDIEPLQKQSIAIKSAR